LAGSDETPIRFVQPSGAPTVVLKGSGGRLRGKAWVANVGDAPIHVLPEAIEAAAPRGGPSAPSIVLDATPTTIVAPGETEQAKFTGTIDPFTPPGTYKAKVTVNGVVEEAILEVTENISLSLSDTKLVVFGDPGPQHRRIVATNRGNISLPIRRLGPVELDVDRPSWLQSKLDQFLDGGHATVPRSPLRDPDEPVPTVEARLEKRVELAPGETAALDWIVEVTGSLQPGIRYRAIAALYTSDVTFIVTPSQDGTTPPAPTPRTSRARTQQETGPRTAARKPASGRKRRPS
jgi:hypothetical protein